MFFSKSEVLAVEGMSCGHCEQTVEKGLQEIPGLKKVKADHQQNQVTVYYKGDAPDMKAVQQKIVALGYEVA